MRKRTGYLYILVHPSEADLYKIGVTTRDPLKRLAEHNTNYKKIAGRIVQETGQKWEMKEFHAVVDVYVAEKVFWGNSPLADMPFTNGEEVWNLRWEEVQKALDAVIKSELKLQANNHE